MQLDKQISEQQETDFTLLHLENLNEGYSNIFQMNSDKARADDDLRVF